MKKILMVFAIMFIACGDNSVSPEQTYTQPVQRPVYSSSSTQPVQRPVYSSSSTQPVQQPVYSSSSTQPVQQPVYSSSSTQVSYWSFEVGNVCKGYNINISTNDKSKPVEGYIAMNQICGNTTTLSYICEPMDVIAENLVYISNGNKQFGTDLINLAKQYDAAFMFYDAVDGYLRYAYLELCYDGKALLKRQ